MSETQPLPTRPDAAVEVAGVRPPGTPLSVGGRPAAGFRG